MKKADAVIFATDIGVKDRQRFAGKPVIESGVKRAINEPVKMLEEAVAATKNPNAPKVAGGGGSSSSDSSEAAEGGLSVGKRMQQAVMTGVSYMVPFVAAGGLLLALGFLVGGYQIGEQVNGIDPWKQFVTEYSLTNLPPTTVDFDGKEVAFAYPAFALYLGSVLFATGQAAMGFCCHVVGQPKSAEGAAIPHAGGHYPAGHLAGRWSGNVPTLGSATGRNSQWSAKLADLHVR